MNRRIWTGVIAGVLAASVLLAVGIGAYEAGRDDAAVTRLAGDRVVEVVGHHWHGPGFGFFLFPLFAILLVALIARAAFGRGRWYRNYGGWGPAGPHGDGPPGPYGPDPEDRFDEWHRRSHERGVSSPGAGAPEPATSPADDPQDVAPPGRYGSEPEAG